ncbi:MAG TPA: FAD-dependent monooxygenase [Gemmatimonadaceae bacterium]|nr:FAD-dependent monooxygenase [Gemmatimonadaceae bacterium]
MSESTTDVLIVGAGPTGLFAATVLARLGVACRIIDKAPGRAPQSRALGVHARTLETLDLVGIADAFIEHGEHTAGMSMRFDTGPRLFLDMTRLESRFPYILIQPQSDTEAMLEARLAEFGTTVEREVEWMDFTEGRDGVLSHLRLRNGQDAQVRSRYLIGCDGAHSAVRHALELPFMGAADAMVAFLADVELDGALDRSRLHMFGSPRGLTVFFPFADRYVRVIAIDFTAQHTTPDTPLTLPELQQSVDAITPIRFVLRDPRWITRFGAHHRQVAAYRVGGGRIFVAGDAAHVHNPAGGQGMNTGLQDAFNLGWKLGFVLTGRAPESLLDSFQAERHPVGADVLRLTERMLRVFFVRNAALRLLRDMGTRLLLPRAAVQRAMRRTISGIGISYRFTDQARRDRCRTLRAHAVQAGDRVPDVTIERAGEAPSRLYLLLRDPAYVIFIVARLDALSRDRRRLAELVRFVRDRYGDSGVIRPFVVLDTEVPAALGIEAPIIVDRAREFRDRVGAEHGSVLLVRPDAYVGFHFRGFDRRALARAFRGWVQAPVHPTSAPLASPAPRHAAHEGR